MATAPLATAPHKISFAKVVASNPKEHISVPAAAKPPIMERRAPPSIMPAVPAASPRGPPTSFPSGQQSVAHGTFGAKDSAIAPVIGEIPNGNELAVGMKELKISSSTAQLIPTPNLVVNGSSPMESSQVKHGNGVIIRDDASQRADSNSELGAKAPSLDGKSITSGTTFALDEKESLRPDDSASVKAAAEDDESISFRGSGIIQPRFGSDVVRIHRLKLGDMPEKRIIQKAIEPQEQGIATPQSGVSSQPPPMEPAQSLGVVNESGDVFNSMYGQNPDEKLLDAMQSPKDRLFLLRLEQDVINFVQSSKEPYMDLPPNNSFCRMLTHKLADYYHMTHSFEAVQGAVRIYRTPFCRVPPSLASFVEVSPSSNTNTPPPVMLPRKIMRRGEEGGSGQGSNSASKATSEVGSDGQVKTIQPKEKKTREEREEEYNKVRAKIFGNSETLGETTPDAEDDNDISRASSVSAKDKSNLGKRGKVKQRRDDSDGFESRSQFIRQYQANYQGQQFGWSPQFIPAGGAPYNVPVQQQQQQQPYLGPLPQVYQAPPQPYPPMVSNNGFPPFGNAMAYTPQAQPAASQYTASSGPMAAFMPPAQPPPTQPWPPAFQQGQSPSSSPFPNRTPQPQPSGTTTGNGIPYAFGQLPVNVNPNDPKSQHPIPGSYNRHAFNPKTQSFVPNGGLNTVQPPMSSFAMGASHGSPPVGSPHLAYSTYSSPAQGQPFMAPPGYGMSRQSSNNSLPPAYHPLQHLPQHLPQHPPSHLPQMPPQMPSKPGHPQGLSAGPGNQPFSHLPNYGNPATLPQKPPTTGM